MISTNPHSGFSLIEVLIASGLFVVSFVASLQLYQFMFGHWEQQHLYQLTHQKMLKTHVELDALNNENATNFTVVAAQGTVSLDVKNEGQITHITLEHKIPLSPKLASATWVENSIESTHVITSAYDTQWIDVTSLAPLTAIDTAEQ